MVEPQYKADVIKVDGFTYVVDNRYPIGDKFLGLAEHDLKVINTIKFLTEEYGYYRINGDFKTYYYPEAEWGAFHIIATDDPKGKNY